MGIDDWVSIVGGFLGIAVFVYIISTGHDERHDEDDQRDFFDEHGHWPDEDQEAVALAEQRRREEDRRRLEEERRVAAARRAERRLEHRDRQG